MSKDQISVCRCGAPLVYTFAFSGAEYFCVECGRKYGMFDAEQEDATPEIKKRLKRNEKRWVTMRKGLLSGGAMLRDCDTCSQNNEPHLSHATELEKTAHTKAMKRINDLIEKED